MLKELVANTGAEIFAIGSTLFFLIIFTVIAVRVLTRRAGSYDATARLPLEGDDPAEVQSESRAGGR